SYRAGIELQAGVQLLSWLEWAGNATFSQNKVDKYTQYISKLDAGTQIARTYSNVDIAFAPSFIGSSVLSFSREAFTADFITKYVSRQYMDNTQTKSRSLDPYLVNNLRIAYSLGSFDFVEAIEATLQLNNRSAAL